MNVSCSAPPTTWWGQNLRWLVVQCDPLSLSPVSCLLPTMQFCCMGTSFLRDQAVVWLQVSSVSAHHSLHKQTLKQSTCCFCQIMAILTTNRVKITSLTMSQSALKTQCPCWRVPSRSFLNNIQSNRVGCSSVGGELMLVTSKVADVLAH